MKLTISSIFLLFFLYQPWYGSTLYESLLRDASSNNGYKIEHT